MENYYTEQAERLTAAIQSLAADPELIEAFRNYIAQHGEKWYNHYANTFDGLMSELELFATPYLPF